MLLKLCYFLLGLGLCCSASAGYVQYTFQNTTFKDGGTLDGFFIQNDIDQSIAYYSIHVNGGALMSGTFGPSGHESNLQSAYRRFYDPSSPTSFHVFNALPEPSYLSLNIRFHAPGSDGHYRVGGWQNESRYVYPDDMIPGFRRIAGGTVVLSAVDPLTWWDSGEFDWRKLGIYNDGLKYLVPTPMPEPGSLALMAIALASLPLVRVVKVNGHRKP